LKDRSDDAMKWQNLLQRIVKSAILGIACMSISLASAQEFTLGQEKLLGEGIFSPDGNLLAVKTVAGVLLFDTASLQPILGFSIPGSSVNNLTFSYDSRYLACAWVEAVYPISSAIGMGVWDLSTYTQVAYFQLRSFYSTIDLYFVPGGELLAALVYEWPGTATILEPGEVHLWKVETWEKHGSWGKGHISIPAFTHDGKRFSISTVLGSIGAGFEFKRFIVDVQTLEAVSVRGNRPIEEHIIAYSPDGRFEVVWMDRPETGQSGLLIRDSQNHNLITKLYEGKGHNIRFHGISPDSKWLATTNKENQVFLWNTQTWEIDHQLTLPSGQIIAEGFVKASYWCADFTLNLSYTSSGVSLYTATGGSMISSTSCSISLTVTSNSDSRISTSKR